jgi:hypothetical protein
MPAAVVAPSEYREVHPLILALNTATAAAAWVLEKRIVNTSFNQSINWADLLD